MQNRSWSSRILLSAFQGQNSIFDQKLCNFSRLAYYFYWHVSQSRVFSSNAPSSPHRQRYFDCIKFFVHVQYQPMYAESSKLFFDDEKMISSKHWLKKDAILLSHSEERNFQSALTTTPFEKKIWYVVILLSAY